MVYAAQTGSFGEDLQFQIGNVKSWICRSRRERLRGGEEDDGGGAR